MHIPRSTLLECLLKDWRKFGCIYTLDSVGVVSNAQPNTAPLPQPALQLYRDVYKWAKLILLL